MNTLFLSGDDGFRNDWNGVDQLYDVMKSLADTARWGFIDGQDEDEMGNLSSSGKKGLVYIGDSNQFEDFECYSVKAEQFDWIILLNSEQLPSEEFVDLEGVIKEHLYITDSNFPQNLTYIRHRLQHYLMDGLSANEHVGVELISSLPKAINPLLRGVQKNLEKLADQGLSKDIRQSVKHTLDTLHRSQNLIDELSMFDPEAEEIQVVETHPFEIANVFKRLKQHVKALFADRDIELRINIDSELPGMVLGNESLLHRILFQLLLNSSEYTRQGHIQCSAELVNWPDDEISHLWVRFEVTDTGVGMSELMLKRVRERMLFEGRTGKLGAGLALTQLIVDRLGGTFELESQEQVGTRCIIQLPFDLPDDDELPNKHASDNVPNLSDYQILIVEDNPVNMSVIEQVISETSATITTAENGREAMEVLQADHHDLVMMDVQMPVMDGLEATENILASYKEWHAQQDPPKIIALTAAAMDGDRERCLEAGMVDYITKPFRAEEVFEKMNQYLKGSESLVKRGEVSREQNSDNYLKVAERNGVSNSVEGKMITNIERLREYAQGNEAIVASMIDVFLEHTPEYINLLRRHTEDKNWPLVKKQAHKMKPQMGYVGLDRIVILLERIEEEASTRQRVDQVKALLRKVEQLCDRAMEELALWKEKHQAEKDK